MRHNDGMKDIGGTGRLGDTEREAAVGALEAHRIAGRLDSAAYEDRTVRAAAATVWADLDPLLADLPEPRPRAAVPSGGADLEPLSPATNLDRWGTAVVAVMPFIAVALFFLFDSWLVFLLIPAVAVLVQTGRSRED